MSRKEVRMSKPRAPIIPRDRRFGRGKPQARWWLHNDPYATAIFNALSVSFPKGEAFFVDSVRQFRSVARPEHAKDVAAFIQQEVMHSREHVAFNRRVTDHGYDVHSLEQRIDERLAEARLRPAIVNLAATMAFEHFTAIFAERLLADVRHLDGADPEVAELRRWHAIEEIEHKAVAFDLYEDATRDWSGFKRWIVGVYAMLRVTQQFALDRAQGAIELLRQDGFSGPSVWAILLHRTFIRPGMLRQVLGAWASYFRPGFHPWQRGVIDQPASTDTHPPLLPDGSAIRGG
jgi:predicted metal-dependent hydrolase